MFKAIRGLFATQEPVAANDVPQQKRPKELVADLVVLLDQYPFDKPDMFDSVNDAVGWAETRKRLSFEIKQIGKALRLAGVPPEDFKAGDYTLHVEYDTLKVVRTTDGSIEYFSWPWR